MAAGALPVGKTNLDQFATGLVGTRSPYGAVLERVRPAPRGRAARARAPASRSARASCRSRSAPTRRARAACRRRSTASSAIKPTRGLVSTAGVVPACRSLDCVSVFAADVDGGRRALAALAGADAEDPYSRAGRAPARAPGAPLRIGVPAALAGLDAAAAAAWARALADAAALADEVVEVDLDPFLEAGRMLYGGPWVAERYAVAGETLARGRTGRRPGRARARARRRALDARSTRSARSSRSPRCARARRATWDARRRAARADGAGPSDARRGRGRPGRRQRARSARTRTFANLLDLCAVAVPAGCGRTGCRSA